MTTAMDRAWGAGNADSEYWFHAQMGAMAGFAAKESADLRRLPALYGAVRSAFAKEVPHDTVTQADVLTSITSLVGGLPPDIAAIATKLGAGPAEQQEIASELLGVDMSLVPTGDEGKALFAMPLDFAAGADDVASLARWASGTLSDARPTVTGLSVSSGPASGGTAVTVYGTNLDQASGFSFGPSTTDSGLALAGTCTPDFCRVAAPPGSGPVNVMADSPGGPSPANAADRFTYRPVRTPSVSHVFPGTGPVAGGTVVSVFGEHLAGGAVFFGPDLAQNSSCTDTVCTATAPQSAGASTVDVAVFTAAGWSAKSAAGQFRYTTGPPPTIKPPTVTGVSPASGDDFGGDTVTITGTGFTGASAVDFGGTFSGAQSYTVVNDTHITAVTPESSSGGAGTVDVTVFNSAGASKVTSKDRFSYCATSRSSPRSLRSRGRRPAGRRSRDRAVLQCWDRRTAGAGRDQHLHAHAVHVHDGGRGGRDRRRGRGCVRRVVREERGGPVQVRSRAGARYHLAFPRRRQQCREHAADRARHEPRGRHGLRQRPAGPPVRHRGKLLHAYRLLGVYAAGKTGTARVVVKRPDGTSSRSLSFTYLRPGKPVVTSVQPAAGWLTGWDEVEVFGDNLSGGTVRFGKAAADSDAVTCTQTDCNVIRTPAGTKTGPVSVTVSAPGGTSAASKASRFTYQRPVVTRISPRGGWTIGGAPITITGSHLGSVDEIGFGDNRYTNFSCTATTCKGTVPSSVSTGSVDVTAVVSGMLQGQRP